MREVSLCHRVSIGADLRKKEHMRSPIGFLLVMCSVEAAFHAGTPLPTRCTSRATEVTLMSATSSDSGAAALGRRETLQGAAGLFGAGLMSAVVMPEASLASGGATAGKYTSIPIAKRRYFGRVKQGASALVPICCAEPL